MSPPVARCGPLYNVRAVADDAAMSHVAFVAGATGYTGRAVVHELRARGVSTYAHVRPDSPKLGEWRRAFEPLGAVVDTTPWTPEAFAARFAEVRPTVAFALLGTTKARARAAGRAGGAPADYETVDWGLTVLLVEAARTVGAKVVYLSSAGADARSRSAYLAVRGRVEARLRESGLPFVSARPSFITGPDRDESRPAERVGAVVADGALGLLGALGARRLRDRYRSTTNVALARALVRLGLDAGATGIVESEDLRDDAP
jgi:uncharacterized protein YbjT (DUF2867 family)